MDNVLYTYFSPEAIELAYHRVRCWPEKLSKDQVGIRAFGDNLEANCERLSEKVIQGAFTPSRGFKFFMPKASRTNRTKTVLFVEDALIYQAIANRIAELQYDRLSQYDSFVFGSVLNAQVKKGCSILEEDEPEFFFFQFWKNLYKKFNESVLHSIEVDKVTHKFETDITGFFDCIPHYNLLQILSASFGVEDKILDILSDCFNRWSGTKEHYTPGVGIPQGPLPSFFFANLLLHDLDRKIVGQGSSYYRYMDDISIYGYNEEEMLESLVTIDNYLKGNGLSLNSKKTSIEKIDQDTTEEKIKALKKIRSFSFYEADEDLIEPNTPVPKPQKKIETKLSELSEQDHSGFSFHSDIVETLVEKEEIIHFWKEEISEVEIELPKLFINSETPLHELQTKEDITDTDFIGLSARYGNALYRLSAVDVVIAPNQALLKYWMFAYDHYFWRANIFGLTLSRYRACEELKLFLKKELSGKFKMYEWCKYFAIQTLSVSQTFTDRELRTDFFPLLNSEKSELVRIALYRLLMKQTGNDQFMASVDAKLKEEKSAYLKLVVLEFKRNHELGQIDLEDFLSGAL